MVSKENIAKKVYNQPFSELCDDKKNIVLTLSKLDNLNIDKSDRFVEISKNSLNFAKIILALFYLIALLFKIKWILIITLFLLLFSVILKSKKDPLVILYSLTIDKIIKPKIEIMDLNALRFANCLGMAFNLISVIFLYLFNSLIGWIIVLLMMVLKIVSALGYCGGVKLYRCMNNGCCMIKKK